MSCARKSHDEVHDKAGKDGKVPGLKKVPAMCETHQERCGHAQQ